MLKENTRTCKSYIYIYDDDIRDLLLTNHLIDGRAIATRCEDIVNMKETDVRVENLSQRYEYAQSLIEHF